MKDAFDKRIKTCQDAFPPGAKIGKGGKADKVQLEISALLPRISRPDTRQLRLDETEGNTAQMRGEVAASDTSALARASHMQYRPIMGTSNDEARSEEKLFAANHKLPEDLVVDEDMEVDGLGRLPCVCSVLLQSQNLIFSSPVHKLVEKSQSQTLNFSVETKQVVESRGSVASRPHISRL